MTDVVDQPGGGPPSPSGPADVLGFDPADPGFLDDPYARYHALRERGPIFRTPAGLFVLTGHELCGAMLRDPRFGHGPNPVNRVNPGQPVESFLRMDPPDHTRLRGLVSRAFTPRMVERLRPRVEAVTAGLIAALPEEGDLVSGFAYPLPVRVICEMLGVPPEDHERFQGWSETAARSLDPMLTEDLIAESGRSGREFRDYFRDLLELRRRRPGDDLLSALVRVEELTEGELLATCVLLLVAGHETTVNLIANGVLALVRHDLLRHAAERPRPVVEEVLRYDPPVQLTGRVALRDAELGGTPVPAGTAVVALIGAANRDPAAFPDPDRFDLDRFDPHRPDPGRFDPGRFDPGRFDPGRFDVAREPGRHLAFGLGIHFCLGATLARMEGEIALAALAAAAPRMELLDPAPPYRPNLVLRGLAKLPVRLNR
ncbi:Biotin biosynthesis cytochrome P450 [Nonomuraea coxensis DSM 45129]|uniref:Biotin biosynthesis cytochrome P450 n=2 Tax=Nonomuraea coxensis TaxID=404386 RepID=A0ABX8UHG8_9ACTN|nr:Biotin biosynthesis cytochrome P450 [Nonomuraea coxensis DSM 45129]